MNVVRHAAKGAAERRLGHHDIAVVVFGLGLAGAGVALAPVSWFITLVFIGEGLLVAALAATYQVRRLQGLPTLRPEWFDLAYLCGWATLGALVISLAIRAFV